MSHRTDVETREASDPQNERPRVLMAMINIWISIMPIVFDLLYREFIRARLAEMRKQLLLWPGTRCRSRREVRRRPPRRRR
jgi:hypothetical protein